MRNPNGASEAGFLSVDYVNFLVLVIVVGLVAAFVVLGLVGRILLVVGVGGFIGVSWYLDWASSLGHGDVVRIGWGEHKGRTAVVAPNRTLIVRQGDEWVETGFSDRLYPRLQLEKVLKWGIPQTVESLGDEGLMEAYRAQRSRRDVLQAYGGPPRPWVEVAVVTPQEGARVQSADGRSRADMQKEWRSRYGGEDVPNRVAVRAGHRSVVVGGAVIAGERTFAFEAEGGHAYEVVPELDESQDPSVEGGPATPMRLVDTTTGQVIEEQLG